MVGAEGGASDSDRCSAVRAQAANTLMNLNSCCQPCIEFSPRFFHYKNVSVTVILLLLLQLLLLCVSVSLSLRICCASAHCLHRSCAAQPVYLSLSLSLSASPSLLLLVSFCLPLPVPVSLSRLLLFVNFPLLATISLALLCLLSSALVCSCSYPCCTLPSSFGLFFDFPSQFFFAATAEQTYSLFSLLVPSSLFKVALHSIHNPHSIHTKSKPMSFRAAPTQKSQ